MGSVTEQKADAESVQNMANAASEVVDQAKRIHEQMVDGQIEQMSERKSVTPVRRGCWKSTGTWVAPTAS